MMWDNTIEYSLLYRHINLGLQGKHMHEAVRGITDCEVSLIMRVASGSAGANWLISDRTCIIPWASDCGGAVDFSLSTCFLGLSVTSCVCAASLKVLGKGNFKYRESRSGVNWTSWHKRLQFLPALPLEGRLATSAARSTDSPFDNWRNSSSERASMSDLPPFVVTVDSWARSLFNCPRVSPTSPAAGAALGLRNGCFINSCVKL